MFYKIIMTAKSILEQIDVIRKASAKASVSKEAAAEFLSNAGIIKNSENSGIVSRSSKSGGFVTRSATVVSKSERRIAKKTTNTHYKSIKKSK